MKTLIFSLLFIGILAAPKVLSGQTGNKLFFGERNFIHSEILAEDKEYWIHLPADYEKSQEKYPVLYITDGDEHFCLAAGLTEFMSSQFLIPEFIVVAIFHRDRNHDLTPTHCLTDYKGFQSDAVKTSGGGEKLLQFIENELIVQIDSKYRTTSFRILAGHSLGGLFSVYAYLNRGDLFDGYIAMDPVLNWDNSYCEGILKTLPAQSINFKNKLYISSAHNAPEGKRDRGLLRKSQLSFSKELKRKGVINARHELFEKDNHMTVPYRSLYAGLSYIFSGYYIFKNSKFAEEIPFIQDHYRKMSDLYGMNFIPPEGLIEMLGKYLLLDMNDCAKSLEFFKLNTVNYPESYKAFENLAIAYKTMGDAGNAILNFKKSLELNPDNYYIQRLLIEIETK